MKLWIVSDLHCDHYPWVPNRVPEHEVMIVAGDLGDGALDAIGELLRIRRRAQGPIVFVPGNHDHFGDGLDRFEDVEVGGVHVLSAGQHIVINGVRFVGATLWTDWLLGDTEFASQSWAARNMPEYQRVLGPDGGKLWPIHTSTAHGRHRSAIEAVLATPHDGPTVVVTHHAPSGRSIKGGLDAASAAFASDLEGMIRQHQPQLWVHGHIHQHADYMIGSTRILANPRGYEGADWFENSGFVEDLVVDV